MNGIVQGVGFRPFVYRLANASGLTGYVRNTAQGVEIEIEGIPDKVQEFLRHVEEQAPPASRITTLKAEQIVPKQDTSFDILISSEDNYRHTLVSPDLATCPDCLKELFDPADRRFRYPLINCMHCGPRFTIIRDIPYDRRNTTMNAFQMCEVCLSEYHDPENRRFHSQPNACPECGPVFVLRDAEANKVNVRDPVGEAVQFLKKGAIIAVKGIGGFHLACDAFNRGTVRDLRNRKKRDEKPFAVMVRDIYAARSLVRIERQARQLLQSVESPIVLVSRTSDSSLPEEVAPGNRLTGLMFPYTPVHHLLMQEHFQALVMTSANICEEPIVFENHDAFSRLKGVADFYLVHDRPIHMRSDDSVFHIVNGFTRPVRRSRGYVPVPVPVRNTDRIVLAVGGELKNTIALLNRENVFISQHIGDLENAEILQFFEQTIRHFEALLSVKPQAIAYDMHPDYLSTRWAREQALPGFAVQHHHAHIGACLAENQIDEKVMGIALDGTGYGSDGHLWGGELMIADVRSFERIAHFKYAPLPGGQAAIREPWRMALSYYFAGMTEGSADSEAILDLPVFKQLDQDVVKGVLNAIRLKINTPLTSSTGRLFDAVSFLCGCTTHASYEGQPAVMLEQIMPARPSESAYDGFDFDWGKKPVEIDTQPLFQLILEDLLEERPVSQISLKFHNALIELLLRLIHFLSEDTGLKAVALSGGCFQNRYLSGVLSRKLESRGFRVYTHRRVPCNDGGLSLGQAVIAANSVFS